MPEIPDISRNDLLKYLDTSFVGRSVVSELELQSTNDTATALAQSGVPNGLTVIADHQTSGRGRNGRTWQSPPGKNLYFSIVLRPACPVQATPQLAIVAALSITQALGLEGRNVKWPNDIWLNGAKLCGILCSMSCTGNKVDYVVMGIGLNVNMTTFPEDIPGTSLAIEFNHDFSRAKVLADVLNTLEKDYLLWCRHFTLLPFFERWKNHSMLDGKLISAEHGHDILTGIADGITPEGLLILKCQDGSTKLISAGDTHILMQK